MQFNFIIKKIMLKVLAMVYLKGATTKQYDNLVFEKATHGVQLEYPEKYRSIYINDMLKKQIVPQPKYISP